MIIIHKLQGVCNQLSSLLPQLRNINVKNFSLLPKQINNVVVGENKIPLLVNKSVQEVVESDLNGIESIGNSAFSYCYSLTSIEIPNSVTSIGDSAFYSCESLTSITIPDSATSIGNSAFFKCAGLTSITVPDGVTSIDSGAFSGCTGLTSITIPDSVTSIGYGAFYDCYSLTSIEIPDSVTSIGGSAFDDTAYYNDTNNWENDALYIGNHLIKVKNDISTEYYIVKSGTKTIAGYAIESDSSLKSITIPESVISLGSIHGDNLTDIYLHSTNPPIINGITISLQTATIHVPVGSGDTYKSSTNWSSLADNIVEDIILE